MNGPKPTFDAAIDLLCEADPDMVPHDQVNAPTLALATLLEADRPLTKAELAQRIHRSARTMTDVVGELESAGLIERHTHPRGSKEPDRFELVANE